jgi:GNAT superfamily N-acetyltransferase
MIPGVMNTPSAPEELRVVYLELRKAPPPARSWRGPENIRLEIMSAADYLDLYRRVGDPLRWDTRLKMPIGELESLLAGPSLHIYVLREGELSPGAEQARDARARPPGFCEFDRTSFPEIELKHFGLVPEAQGRGLGSWLLSTALGREWGSGAARIWLHTDEWDHPAAVPVYRRAGFEVYATRREAAEDL